MSYPATGVEPTPADAARRSNALGILLFLCLVAAFLLRFTISPQLLDRVMRYTSESGAFYEKLHLGTYAILLLTPLVLFSRPFVLRADEIAKFRWLLRYALLLVALCAWLAVTNRVGSAGFIIDSYIVAAAAGLMLFTFPEDFRRAVGNVMLALFVISAVIAIGEVATHHRLLPYDLNELTWRPIGLADHPLGLGTLCATAIGFVPLTRWRVWVKVGAILLLLVGCVASGARFALLSAVAEVLALLLFLPWPDLSRRAARQAKAVVLVLALMSAALVGAVLMAGGLLSRFGSTLFDENFFARVTIYDVFNYVSWNNILLGMRGDELLAIVNEKLHLPAIESAPVVIVLLLGAPLALVFALLFARTLYRLLKDAPLAAWIGTGTFLLSSLSNNTFSSKTPVITIIVALLVIYAVPPRRRQTAE